MADKKQAVFVRDATGLVREIGLRDHALTNMNGVQLLITLPVTAIWIFTAVPGGDPILGAVIAMFFIVFGAIVAFALTSATFPRSASPYVAESRILAPWIGWPAEVNQWINWVVGFNLLPSTYFLFMALIPGLYAMGVSSGNPGLIAASTWLISDVRPTLIIGEVFLIGCLFLAIGGTRKLMQFQLIVTAISFIVTALIIGLYATTSSAHFMELVPKYLGNTYNGIVAAGNSQVPSMMVPISYQPYPLLAAAAFSAGSVNTYWNAYGAGEVKRGRDVKMQLISMIIPCIVMTLSIAVAYILLYGMAGRQFLIALVNFSTIGGTVVKAPLSWGGVGIAYTAMMVADNFWLQALIVIGFICGALALVPIEWVILTREIFAWSFDRVIPAKFCEVNDRFHSPLWAIAFNFVIIQAGFIIFTYFAQYMGAFLTITFDVSDFAIMMLCIAAACLPLRKSLWEASPVKYKLFGVPVITIGGILGALFYGLAVMVYTFTPGVGFGLPSTEIIIAFIFTPFILYWIIRAIRKRQGIDLDLIMREIPPE